MPNSAGKICGISVPSVPWHESDESKGTRWLINARKRIVSAEALEHERDLLVARHQPKPQQPKAKP